jgi:hypothetical protein
LKGHDLHRLLGSALTDEHRKSSTVKLIKVELMAADMIVERSVLIQLDCFIFT